jgi:hypothetical protein
VFVCVYSSRVWLLLFQEQAKVKRVSNRNVPLSKTETMFLFLCVKVNKAECVMCDGIEDRIAKLFVR